MSTTTSVPRPPIDNLFDFAWIPPRGDDVPSNKAFDSRLSQLAARAQAEAWTTDPVQPYAILANYLRYTFKRLIHEGKVVEGTDGKSVSVAAFNTGLFTDNYEAIFAFFEANRDQTRQPWVLKDFIVESDRRLDFFPGTPKPARYFDNPADLLYDPALELVPNLDHIVDDNVDRYPAALRDNKYLRRITLQGAVEHAAKRAQMNYKVAVPQFYFGPGGAEPGHIQLLLPLCFDDPKRADLALVVEREERVYRAFTVLPLDLAYKNARLIARPDTDWLPPLPPTTSPIGPPAPSMPTTDGEINPAGTERPDVRLAPEELERRFHEEMLNVYRRAKSECRYNAGYFLKMVNEHGGLKTAKILLDKDDVSEGFTALWERGRLDLTVEAVVLTDPWHTLFSDTQLETARKRLQDLGYQPAAEAAR